MVKPVHSPDPTDVPIIPAPELCTPLIRYPRIHTINFIMMSIVSSFLLPLNSSSIKFSLNVPVRICLLLHVFLLLLTVNPSFTFASANPAPITLTWISEPIYPNETVLLTGNNFDASCMVNVSTTSSFVSSSSPTTILVPILANQSTDSVLKFFLPPGFPEDVYSLFVSCANAQQYIPSFVNLPKVWWILGDGGEEASPGGWLRIQGINVAYLSNEIIQLKSRLRQLKRFLQPRGGNTVVDVLQRTSYLTNEGTEEYYDDNDTKDETLKALYESLIIRKQLQQLMKKNSNGGPSASYVQLVSSSGTTYTLPAIMINATQFSIHVPLPSTMVPDTYTVTICNGYGTVKNNNPNASVCTGTFVPVDIFLSAQRPHVTTITIVDTVLPSPPSANIFIVNQTSLPQPYPFFPNATSDAAVQYALQQAQAAGGGTVYFPAGTYFLTEPLIIPSNTILAGERNDAVGLYFAEATNITAPVAYFMLNDTEANISATGTGSWGIRDLSIFITGFHFHVIYVINYTRGFFLDRVVARVNAFFAQNNPFTQTHGRWSNWTLEQPGNLVQMQGSNWKITNCDLYSTWNVVTSFNVNGKIPCDPGNYFPNNCHGSSFGYMGDNMVYNGGASHFMNQWMQIIYERNINTGISVISMGQSVGTGPDGGYAQNIYHSDNVIRLVNGNDKEVITFDDAGGSFWGTLASVNFTTLITSQDCRSAGDDKAGAWLGGSVVVVNGTGVGQIRRIVEQGIGPEPTNPNNRTWVVNQPFDIPPLGNTTFVQIMPYRGQNIFIGDQFEDGGAFQFYGHGLDNIVVDTIATRMTGFIAWGQWRGWIPPNASTVDNPVTLQTTVVEEVTTNTTTTVGLGLEGQMGNGLQPNMRNMFLRNTFLGSLSCPNYNYSVGYDPYYARRFFSTQAVDNIPEGQAASLLLIYRGNTGGGGLTMNVGTSHVIIENGKYYQDTQGIESGSCILFPVEGQGTATYVYDNNVECIPGIAPNV